MGYNLWQNRVKQFYEIGICINTVFPFCAIVASFCFKVPERSWEFFKSQIWDLLIFSSKVLLIKNQTTLRIRLVSALYGFRTGLLLLRSDALPTEIPDVPSKRISDQRYQASVEGHPKYSRTLRNHKTSEITKKKHLPIRLHLDHITLSEVSDRVFLQQDNIRP